MMSKDTDGLRDLIDNLSDEKYNDLLMWLLRETRVTMEKDKLKSLLINKVQNENR